MFVCFIVCVNTDGLNKGERERNAGPFVLVSHLALCFDIS